MVGPINADLEVEECFLETRHSVTEERDRAAVDGYEEAKSARKEGDVRRLSELRCLGRFYVGSGSRRSAHPGTRPGDDADPQPSPKATDRPFAGQTGRSDFKD